MSIARELSSDIAAAVLAARKDDSQHDAGALADVVLEVHSTLRRLTAETRRKSRSPSDSSDAPPAAGGAASGRQ